MKFWFCERCGKRLTDQEIEEGKARDKKLAGVFCNPCAQGVMTLETIPITEEQARKILNSPRAERLPSAPVGEALIGDRRASRPSAQRITPATQGLKPTSQSNRKLSLPDNKRMETGTLALLAMAIGVSIAVAVGLVISNSQDGNTGKRTASNPGLPSKNETAIGPERSVSKTLPAVALPSMESTKTSARPEESKFVPNPAKQESKLDETVLDQSKVSKPLEEDLPKISAPSAKSNPAESPLHSTIGAQEVRPPVVSAKPQKLSPAAGTVLIESHFDTPRVPEAWQIEGKGSNQVKDGAWRVNLGGSKLQGASLATSKLFPLDRKYRLTVLCGYKGEHPDQILLVGVFDGSSKSGFGSILGGSRGKGIAIEIASEKLSIENKNGNRDQEDPQIANVVSLKRLDEHRIVLEVDTTNLSVQVDGVQYSSGAHHGLKNVKEVRFLLQGRADQDSSGGEVWFRAVRLEEIRSR